MRTFFGMIGALLLGACVSTTEEQPVAQLKTLPASPVVQVQAASPVVTPPKPQLVFISCRPKLDEAAAAHFADLGFAITEILIDEQVGDRATITIKRQSVVGAIPMHDRQFESTRYHAKGAKRYGEWEESEHWLRLDATEGKYSGKFIYEGDFAFSVDCEWR